MKSFNLEDALAGKPVVTRDGRPVKIAGYNKDANMGGVLVGWAGVEPWYWSEMGASESDHITDLFMAPTERKEWVVRRWLETPYVLGPFSSIEHAMIIATSESDTIHEITIIE
jgi:hypothetical protein